MLLAVAARLARAEWGRWGSRGEELRDFQLKKYTITLMARGLLLQGAGGKTVALRQINCIVYFLGVTNYKLLIPIL